MKFLSPPTLALALTLGAFLAASMSATTARAADTLYADLGGKQGVATIVEDATANFLADPRIKDTLSESNMDRFKAKLTEQICALGSGPCTYTGHTMAATHRGLHLKNSDFNALIEDLQDALDKSNVPFAAQNRLLALLAPMQKDVVTR